MMVKTLTPEESLMMARAKFAQLRPNDVIALYESDSGGEMRRPGIVREIWGESFSFLPLDEESIEEMLSGRPPKAETKTLPSNASTGRKLLWNNFSR
jgi:hypothetical protein